MVAWMGIVSDRFNPWSLAEALSLVYWCLYHSVILKYLRLSRRIDVGWPGCLSAVVSSPEVRPIVPFVLLLACKLCNLYKLLRRRTVLASIDHSFIHSSKLTHISCCIP